MSSNNRPLARLFDEPGHVLILKPLAVCIIVQFFTTKPTTSISFSYLPKLPTLGRGGERSNQSTDTHGKLFELPDPVARAADDVGYRDVP